MFPPGFIPGAGAAATDVADEVLTREEFLEAVDATRQRMESRGDTFPSLTIPSLGDMEPIPPTEDALNQNAAAIVESLSGIEASDPWLTGEIANSEAMMAVSQEVAAGLGRDGGDLSSHFISSITGGRELTPFDDVIDRLDNDAEVVSRFFQDYSGKLTPVEKDFLAYLLAPLTPKNRNQTLAWGHQWIEANSLATEEDRTDLMVRLAQVAYEKYNDQKGEDTFLGKLNEAVEVFGEPTRELIANVWARTADPGDSAYRKHLSMGSNIAISAGQTPGTPGWEAVSGVTDALGQFIDPAALAIGWKAGAKLATQYPRVALKSGATTPTKGATALKGLVPWFGKKATPLPRFTRGFTTRMGWALHSRTLDDLFEAGAAGTRAADAMFAAVQKGGTAELITQFPAMKVALDGVGQLIVDAKSADEVADILRHSLEGGFIQGNGVGMSQLKNAFEETERLYNETIDAALDGGDIGFGNVGVHEGFDATGEFYVLIDGQLTAGSRLEARALEGTGEELIGFRGKPRTLDLNDRGVLEAYARWAQAQSTAPATIREVLENPQDFLVHGIGGRVDPGGIRKGGLVEVADIDIAEIYARRGEDAGNLVFVRKTDLPPHLRNVGEELTTSRIYSSAERSVPDIPQELQGLVDEFRSLRPKEFQDRYGELDEAARALGFADFAEAIGRTGHDLDNIFLDVARTVDEIPISQAVGVDELADAFSDDIVLANRLLRGDLNLTPDDAVRLNRYADALGNDVIRIGNGAVLTNRGAANAVLGADTTVEAGRFAQIAGRRGEDYHRARTVYSKALSGDTQAFVLNSMPVRVRKNPLAPWRKLASNDAKGWWGHRRRLIAAKFFNKPVPSAISIDNTSEMVKGFGRFARSLGASESFVRNAVNRLTGTRMMDRYDTVTRLIGELADAVDHPLLKHQLTEYVKRSGVREFMPGRDGMEAAVALSRSDPGATTAIPLIPALLRRSVELPGEDWHRALLRYKAGRRWQNILPNYGRGARLTGTRGRRMKIIQKIRSRLEKRKLANPELTNQIDAILQDDSQLYAMAYASVFENGIGDGVGLLAKTGATLWQRAYTPFHRVFSIAQLAFRPLPWMFRVNIDEQSRGALMDQPSLFRNPFRQMQTWWDSYHVSKSQKWVAQNTQWASSAGTRILAASDDRLYAEVAEIFPEVTEQLGKGASREQLTRYVRTRLNAVAHGDEALRPGLGGHMDMSRWAMRRVRNRGRNIRTSNKIKAKYGLSSEFSWDDAMEIQHQGQAQLLTEEMAGAVEPVSWSPRITEAEAYNYGTAWASKSTQYANDPIMQVAMDAARHQARRGADANLRGYAGRIVASRYWHELRTNYRRLATKAGWDDVLASGDDVALAERVLREILMEQVDHIYAPLWANAADPLSTKARVLDEILTSRTATFTAHDGIEYTFDYRKSAGGQLRSTIRDFVAEEQSTAKLTGVSPSPMPARIAAHFDPFYAAHDNVNIAPKGFRRFTDFMIATFGEKATQSINRRGAYITSHGRHYQRFKALGLSDEAAREAAHGEAYRLVNYIYYHTDDTVPLLRDMNKVIPFFSAAWEVAQTWAYKIPKEIAGGGYAVFGWPKMARMVDRAFDAMIHSQVVEVQDDGSYRFVLSSDPGYEEAFPLANFISKAGHAIATAPLTVAEHLAGWGQSVTGGDGIVDFTPDEISFAIAAPIDPFGQGVGNALSFHLGLNPIIAYATAGFKDRVYDAVDANYTTSDGTVNFEQIQDKTGIDAALLLRANEFEIKAAVGKSEYNKLLSGQIPLDTYVLPEGVKLIEPGSSLVGQWVDDSLFPFGGPDSPQGVIYDLLPSWSTYIMRSLGLWAGDGGHPDGFLEFFEGPAGVGMVHSAVIDGLRHLEANEGMLTELAQMRSAVKDFIDRNGELFILDPTDDSVRARPGADAEAFAAAEEEYIELYEEMDRYAQMVIKRASDIAGGQLLTRGLMGFYLPANPRTYQRGEYMANDYYESQDFIEGKTIPRIKGVRDYESFAFLMQSWWEDPLGDTAKRFLQQTRPGIQMWFEGKSFWTDGGVPAEIEEVDEYFDLLADEILDIKYPEIWMLDQAHGSLSLQQEFNTRERFGSDPVEAWNNILADYASYRQLGEDEEIARGQLDWFDDLVFGGAYENYQNTDRRTTPSLGAELRLATFDKFKNLDSLAGFVSDLVDATPDEAADMARVLRQAQREVRDAFYELIEQPDFREYMNERELIAEDYFKLADAWYERVGEIFAPLEDPMLDSEERSLVFENWRMLQNEVDGTMFEVRGNEFIHEIDRSWNSKDEEEKSRTRLKGLMNKPEWLSTVQIRRILEEYPEARDYLPASPELWDQLTELNNELTAAVESGELSSYRKNQAMDKAEEIFLEAMIGEGREKEVAWANATPLQRLELVGSVPPFLEAVMPQYRGMVQLFEDNELGLKSTSTPAKQARVVFWDYVKSHLATIPGGAQAFQDFGLNAFGDDFKDPDEIAAVLFFGDRWNDL